MMRTKYGELVPGNDIRRPKSGRGDFASRLDEKSKEIRFRRQRAKSQKPVRVQKPVSASGERVLSICGK